MKLLVFAINSYISLIFNFKIEQGVVGGYTKIEDKFVDAYLTKDGETVEEAKNRLKNVTSRNQ